MASNLAPGISRDLFIESLVSSFSKQIDTEQTLLLRTPLDQLSPTDLMRLDEAALAATDNLSFDFPQPSASQAHALATALIHFTSVGEKNGNATRKDHGASADSLFAREFSISKGFIDGIVYCAARARPRAEKVPLESAGEEDDETVAMFRTALSSSDHVPSPSSSASTLNPEVVAELAALVLVKCVKLILLGSDAPTPPHDSKSSVGGRQSSSSFGRFGAGAVRVFDSEEGESLARRLLCDPLLEELVPSGRDSTPHEDETGKDSSNSKEEILQPPLQQRTGSVNEGSGHQGEEEEVWAAELDDDDVPYEALDPQTVARLNTEAAARQASIAATSAIASVGIRQLRLRFAYLIKAFSSNLLSSLPPHAWARLNLAQDIGVIVSHLRRRVRGGHVLLRDHDESDTTTAAAKTAASSSSSAASTTRGGGGDEQQQEQDQERERVLEAGWVAYAYAVRDHLIMASTTCPPPPSTPTPSSSSPSPLSSAPTTKGSGGASSSALNGSPSSSSSSSSSPSLPPAVNVVSPLNTAVFSLLNDDVSESEQGGGGSGSNGTLHGTLQDGEGVVLSPGRCVGLLIARSLVKSVAWPSSSSSSSSPSSPPSSTAASRLLLLSELRRGLASRLPTVLSSCLEAVADSVTSALASNTNKQSPPQSDDDDADKAAGAALALALEQAKAVLACVGFACGVTLSSAGDHVGFTVHGLPPTSALLGSGGHAMSSSSQCFRNLVKLLAVVTPPKSRASEAVEQEEQEEEDGESAVGMCRRLVSALVIQDPALCAYALRAPSTASALAPLFHTSGIASACGSGSGAHGGGGAALEAAAAEKSSDTGVQTELVGCLEPGAVLLALSLAIGSHSATDRGGCSNSDNQQLTGRVHALAQGSCDALLEDLKRKQQQLPRPQPQFQLPRGVHVASSGKAVGKVSGAVVVAAALGRLPPRALARVREWGRSLGSPSPLPHGGWFNSWLAEVQTEILLTRTEHPRKEEEEHLKPHPPLSGPKTAADTTLPPAATPATPAAAAGSAAGSGDGGAGSADEASSASSVAKELPEAATASHDEEQEKIAKGSDRAEVTMEKSPAEEAKQRAPDKAVATLRADAIKAVKVLLETSAGGNKTD